MSSKVESVFLEPTDYSPMKEAAQTGRTMRIRSLVIGVSCALAGAAALRAGLPPSAIGELRRAHGAGSLAVPLATLADLVARGVPVATAQEAVTALAARDTPDAGYVELRRVVEADIGAGVPPAASASVRAQGGRPPDKVVPPGASRGKKTGQQPSGTSVR